MSEILGRSPKAYICRPNPLDWFKSKINRRKFRGVGGRAVYRAQWSIQGGNSNLYFCASLRAFGVDLFLRVSDRH